MKFRPLGHPLNWYDYDVTGSIELLDSYVSDIESQVVRAITNFEANVEEIVIEGDHPEEPPRFIQYHQGLDDGTWDLREIFRQYFPNLQRRSALITLFSFFEHELNKLCTLFQVTEKYSVGLRDINGNGIERARTYLCKVASLELDLGAEAWSEVKNVQALRNLIVHADGRLHDPDGQERRPVARYVETCPLLEGTTEVLLRAGYLKHALESFNTYFVQVNHAIRRRYDA